MQPRTIGSEQHFARAGPLHRLLEEIEAADTRRVGIDVGMAHDDDRSGELRPPVVRKAPEVRNDEVDIGVFLREELGGGRSPITSYSTGRANARAASHTSRVIRASWRWSLMPTNP